MKSFKNYKHVPRKIDKKSDGSYMYPDRKSWHGALTKYAEINGLDAKELISSIEKEDKKKYK